ncbi:CrcB protein [Roseovarius sp. MBR-78]|uniref:fluoride efflux transporter CrcB n=1 Tax=Roseovarius sp. MBR-78 TaxID=3156460 RepID=UPI00339ACDC9
MMMMVFQVAVGGALGAVLRLGVTLGMARVAGPGFPMGVLAVNVLGSFLIGVLAVLSFQRGFDHLNPLLITGVLGGFTTFSTFSLEALTLMERGALGAALAYVGLSVGLSLGAVALGAWSVRALAS